MGQAAKCVLENITLENLTRVLYEYSEHVWVIVDCMHAEQDEAEPFIEEHASGMEVMVNNLNEAIEEGNPKEMERRMKVIVGKLTEFFKEDIGYDNEALAEIFDYLA